MPSSPVPPPRIPADPALMDRETLEDEYCLSCERYEELYSAYSQLAVLMDALHRENELLRADVGDASIATADQPHEPSAAAAAKAARTAATELQSEVNALRAENAQLRRAQEADERVRAELADRIEGLESEVADLHDRKEEEVQELRAVVRALEGQLERLQVDLKEGDGMVARLEKATRVLRREAEAKAQALRQAKQEVLALQQANDELETRLLASVRPSPPRMLGSPAAAVTTAAAAFVTPEAPSAHAESTTTTAKALQEANAALRQRVVTAAKAHAQMWNAGEQLAAELLEAKGQAHFWKREALLWRDEVATRAAGESDGDGDGHTRGEVARLKSKLERVLRGKERLRAVWEKYEREGLEIRQYRCR